MTNNNNTRAHLEKTFFLSEIIGKKIILRGKKLGKLTDMVISEKEKIPEVSHLVVARPFGYPPLLIPWENVESLQAKKAVIDIDPIEAYAREPEESQILLKDFILDKKVLDLDDNEVEIVYDVKLVLRNNVFYVSEVDFSKYGLLRRIKLKWLADFVYSLADKFKEETISWTYVQPLPEKISSFKGAVKLKVLKEKLPEIHPVDLADILEELNPDQRLAIFNELDAEQASDTLEEIEPRVQRDLISSLEPEKTAELINDMTPGQAADVLAALPTDEADNILARIDKESAEKIQLILDKQDQKILNFATMHFLKFPPLTQAGLVLRQFRYLARGKDVIMYLYVVDEKDTLLGVVDIREVLQANLDDILGDLMTTHVISLNTQSTLVEASEMFSRYSFRAVPITDEKDIILGVIPYRDVMNLKHRFV